jgi:hypothetical protein
MFVIVNTFIKRYIKIYPEENEMKRFAVLLRFLLLAVIVIGSVFSAYNSTLAKQGPSILVKINGNVSKISDVYLVYQLQGSQEVVKTKMDLDSQDSDSRQYSLEKTFSENDLAFIKVLIVDDGQEKEYALRQQGNGNPQGDGTLVYWLDLPVNPEDPGTENPDDPGTENPDDPGTENPDDPGTENPEDPGTENPEDPGTENPDDPGTENPDDPGTENPDDPGTENPDDPGTENPDDPGTENPDDPGTENPDDPGTENPDDPGTENPDDPGTENPDDPGTENPDDPGTENPDDPGTENPDDPGTENPDEPGTENPENPGTQNPGTQTPGTVNTPQQPSTTNPQQSATNNTGTVQTVTKTVSGGELPDTSTPWMNWLLLSGLLAVGSAASLFKFRKL